MRCWETPGQQAKAVVEIGQTIWQAEGEPLTQEADWGGIQYREWRLEQLATLRDSSHQLLAMKSEWR